MSYTQKYKKSSVKRPKVRGLNPAKVVVSCIAVLVLVWLIVVLIWSNKQPQNQPAAREARQQMDVKHNRPGDWLKRQQRAVSPPVAVPLDAIPVTTSTSSLPTSLVVNTNVLVGYKRIKVTLVGTGFETQSTLTNQVSMKK